MWRFMPFWALVRDICGSCTFATWAYACGYYAYLCFFLWCWLLTKFCNLFCSIFISIVGGRNWKQGCCIFPIFSDKCCLSAPPMIYIRMHTYAYIRIRVCCMTAMMTMMHYSTYKTSTLFQYSLSFNKAACISPSFIQLEQGNMQSPTCL